MLTNAFVPEQLTGWDGKKKWGLLCTKLPGKYEVESEGQGIARHIVDKTIGES